MLQRIQTIYLIVAILAMFGLMFTAQDVDLFGNGFIIDIAVLASGILSIVTILKFKNRKKQILLNYLNILINALLVGFLVYWMLNLSGGIDFPEKGIEFVFPIVAIIMFILANVNIYKDEKLVKSVDRFR